MFILQNYKNFKVLVTGDRNYNDRETISYTLKSLLNQENSELYKWKGSNITLIEGECRGADLITTEIFLQIAKEYLKLDFKVERYPVTKEDYCLYGRKAPILRNQKMINEGKPDIVIAFHKNVENSKGTKDTINRALNKKLPVILIYSEANNGLNNKFFKYINNKLK